MCAGSASCSIPTQFRAPSSKAALPEWERTLGAQIRIYEARGPDEFEGAFAAMARDGDRRPGRLADTNTYMNRVRLNELCLQRRMLSVWGGRDLV